MFTNRKRNMKEEKMTDEEKRAYKRGFIEAIISIVFGLTISIFFLFWLL